MWALTLWDHGNPYLLWGVAVGVTVIGAATDIMWRRLPNWLTFPTLISGLAFNGWQFGLSGLADSFAACLFLALPFVLLFIFAKGGAGDAKMMGGVGSWLGLAHGTLALAGVAVAGVIVAMIYAVIRRRGREVSGNVAAMAQNLALSVLAGSRLSGTISPTTSVQPMLTMPYGLAIFTGVAVTAIGELLWRT